MDIGEFKNNIKTDNNYDFLRTHPYLGNNICLLTLGGSHAYGTNNESSDIDIRGFFLDKPSDIIGLAPKIEQYDDPETDTIIYSFHKIIKLLMECNPNIIEILGCKPEHYIYLNDIGKEIIKNRRMFLSKRCIYTFGGYANQQLRRLQNALCHDRYEDTLKIDHLHKTLEHTMESFKDKYSLKSGNLRLNLTTESPFSEEKNIYVTGEFNYVPSANIHAMLNELNDIIRTYNKLNGRNKKKDINHLNKHAMHLVRLYYMAFDILEKHEIITYRRNINPILLQVRNGEWSNEDGTFKNEFWDLINEYENKLQKLSKETTLPEKPDFEHIEEFVMNVNRKIINN